MSEVRNFDDYIKGKFNNFSPEVPSHIWDKIVTEREKRKPKGFWLNFVNSRNILLLTGLLLAGGAGVLLLSTNSHTHKIHAVDNSITKITNKADDPSTISSPEAENNTITIKTNQIQDKDSKAQLKNIVAEQNTSVKRTGNIRNGSLNKLPDANIPAAATKSLAMKENQTLYTKRETSNKNNIAGTANINIKNGIVDLSAQDDLNIPGKKIIGIPVEGTLLNRLSFGAEKILAYTPTVSELRKRDFPNVDLPGCPSIEKDAAANKKYFEFYIGPDYAYKILSDTPNSVYLQNRKKSTSFTSAFSAGARYTRVFKNSMSLRIGLNYSQINEKFTFVQGNVVQVTYVIDVNGDTTASYTVRGTRHKTTHNRYRSIDIPVLMGYELGYGRLHANINAGAMINVYSWQKGEVLDANSQPIDITTGKGSSSPYQYKSNVGLSLTGGASIYYKLNDVLHLLAEPYLRYNLASMSKEVLTLRQKYTTVGLRLGIRLDLQ